MNKNDIDNLFLKYNKKHLDFHMNMECTSSTQGKARSERGNFVEKFVEDLWLDIGRLKNLNHEVDNKKHEVKSKSGIYSIKKGLDRNLRIEGTLKAMVECKAYLDSCYLERADNDSSILTRVGYNQPKVVLALEDACGVDSREFWMEQGNIDKVFILVNGKRTSSKPLYKSLKPLNCDKFEELCKWMWQL